MTEFDFDVLVDWDKDGFAHRNVEITDSVNLFGTAALDPDTFRGYIYTQGTLSSSTILETATDYGKQHWSWDTGTSSTAYFYFGFNGATTFALEDLVGTFTAVIWIKQNTGPSNDWDDVPLKLNFYSDDGGGLELQKSTAFTLTKDEGWKQVTVTATTSAPANICFALQKSSVTRALYFVSGPMMVLGSTIPEGFNSGLLSKYDNLSQFIQSGDWQIGFNQPYQYLAPLGRARFTLDNSSGAFYPENPSSPIAGMLNRSLTIDCNRDGERVRMFTGWVDEINPNNGKVTKTCELSASDVRRFSEGRNIYLSAQLDVTAWNLIEAIAAKLNLPANRSVTTEPRPDRAYDEVFPYALDNLPDGFDALQMMADVTGAVQGHTFFNRDGELVFADLRSMAVIADATVFDNNFVDSDYRFGAMLINECTVAAHKRKAGTDPNKQLWDLEEAEELAPLETLEVRADYSNPDEDSNKKIAGLDIELDSTADEGVEITMEDNFTSANITLENTTGAIKNVDELIITGRKLTAFNTSNMRYGDEEAIAEHGILSENLDFSLTNDKKKARALAGYRVGRFKTPRGEMRSITLKPKAFQDATIGDNMRDLTILDPIQVIDDERFHEQYYIVIGESWTGELGFHKVSKTMFLEPTFRIFTLDDAELGLLDAGNHLSLY